MSPGFVRNSVAGYLVVESVLHDGLTFVLGVTALTHGITWLGVLAIAWATSEVVVKTTAAALVYRDGNKQKGGE